jgi:hypothetical protein
LRGKHNLEVEEEVLKDEVKQGLLKERKGRRICQWSRWKRRKWSW